MVNDDAIADDGAHETCESQTFEAGSYSDDTDREVPESWGGAALAEPPNELSDSTESAPFERAPDLALSDEVNETSPEDQEQAALDRGIPNDGDLAGEGAAEASSADDESAVDGEEASAAESTAEEAATEEAGESLDEALDLEAALEQDLAEADEEGTAELDAEQLDALTQTLGVLLFASPEPLSLLRLRELSEAGSQSAVRQGLAELEQRFDGAGLPLVVRRLAGGYRVMTDPRLAEVVQRLDKSRKTERISQAALESLAIIAYRQPVTKAEIEAIRGVQAGPMLRTLVDRGLVKIAGRAEQPGQPLLYGTTKEFLDRFGLGAINELPRDSELAGE